MAVANEIPKNRNIQRLVVEVMDQDRERDLVRFKIAAQTLRGPWFGNDQDGDSEEVGMYDSRHLYLKSSKRPDFEPDSYTLWVRGDSADHDDRILTCAHAQFDNVRSAVEEFNKRFRGSPNCILNYQEAE